MGIMEGLLFINEVDVWKEYGAFLCEEKKGGKENLTAILAGSKTKTHVAVDIREENGEKYSAKLTVTNEARDLTLLFALIADSKTCWLERYRSFVSFLKQGQDGWLSVRLPELGNLPLRVFFQESSSFKPLTYLYKEGRQAGIFKIKFREPNPII